MKHTLKTIGIACALLIALAGCSGDAIRSAISAGKNHRETSNKDAARTHIKILETAVACYNMKHGKYPATLQDAAEYIVDGQLPKPPWGGEYAYEPTGDRGFEISCTAPDGEKISTERAP